jgi:hypothetical protein
MNFNLDLEGRKEIISAKNVSFENSKIVFTNVGIEKETQYKDKKLTVIDDSLSPKQIVELVLRKNVDKVVQNSLQSLSEKANILHRIDQNSNHFFLDEFSFFHENDGIHKIIFDNSTSRQTIINLAFHRLQLDREANRTMSFKIALEEMLMNTQIDAKNISGSEDNKKSILILEKKDKLVAVSMIDYYGSLIYSKFLAPIESCLDIGIAASINHNRQRGAGIGGSLIFGASDSVYLGCQPGIKTRITAIFPVGLSERHQEKLQKSVILI